mgnify:CR=1 FL=1
MKINQYLSQLSFGSQSPSRETANLLRGIREDLNDHTLDIAKQFAEEFGDYRFQSNYYKALSRSFSKEVRFDSLPRALYRSLERMENNISVLEKRVKSRWFDLITHYGTRQYRHAATLRYIEAMSFYVRYYRLMLFRLLAEESMATGKGSKLKWPRGQLMWMDERLDDFVKTYTLMDIDERTLASKLDAASETTVTEDSEETLEAAKASSRDPMNMSALKGFSPIFAIGKGIAELQVLFHKSRKAEVEGLKLRLQDLKEAEAGQADPKRQSIISKIEERIDEIQYKIRATEEAYA